MRNKTLTLFCRSIIFMSFRMVATKSRYCSRGKVATTLEICHAILIPIKNEIA